jgi:hypothetical protein
MPQPLKEAERMKSKNLINGNTRIAFHKGLMVAMGIIGAFSVAHAAPITYTINRSIGGGSLIGTVTTDGTLGLLTGANFLSLNLTVSSGAFSYAIAGAPCSLQNPVSGSPCTISVPRVDATNTATAGLLATATQLTFDASPDPQLKDLFFVAPLNANTSAFYCIANQGFNCPGEVFSGVNTDSQLTRTTIPRPTDGFGVITLAARG